MSLGRPTQLNQVDTEGTLMRSCDSFTGSMIFKSQDMLQKWIQSVTEKEMKALKETKQTKVALSQLQVSYNFIQ